MPCDKNTDDHVFIIVLNTISQLLYKHNPCHIIIGGDMNVDFSRYWGSRKKRARRDPCKTTRPIHLVKLFTNSSKTSNL